MKKIVAYNSIIIFALLFLYFITSKNIILGGLEIYIFLILSLYAYKSFKEKNMTLFYLITFVNISSLLIWILLFVTI